MPRGVGIVSILGPLAPGDKGPTSDYRPVPKSDRGDESYGDRGMLGNYSPSEREPYQPPSDVRFEAGYGATEEDLHRGYCEPTIREDPAYARQNYESRWEMSKQLDGCEPGDGRCMQEMEFRNRNRRSQGFLRRTYLSEDRG